MGPHQCDVGPMGPRPRWQVSEQDEEDLATAPTDEEIAEIFNFSQAKSTSIDIIIEFENDGNTTVAIGGATYPWKDILTEKGFKYDRAGTQLWHAEEGTDTDELEAMFDEYGFTVEKYDNAVENDEDCDEEQ